VVIPQLNTLVLFLSERFPHEVLPAKRVRYSLTGWFRVNSSSEQQVDPAR
jgi:SM-20-related protein